MLQIISEMQRNQIETGIPKQITSIESEYEAGKLVVPKD